MFNFFHNLGLGIAGIFTSITGIFYSHPVPLVQAPIIQVAATSSTQVIATSSISTSTITEKKPKPTPVNSKTDNSAFIQAEVQRQVQAALQAKANQDDQTSSQTKIQTNAPVVATTTQLTPQEIERNAQIQMGIESDKRQALIAAQEQANKDQAAQQAAQQKITDKQNKLDAINLEIANRNAKYAKDMKACSSGGGSTDGVYACQNAYTMEYQNDYNSLMAEFQQVKYSN